MLTIGMTFLLFVFAEEANHVSPWWNYPGLELWKFVNLFIFAAGLIYFVKRPLSEGFKSRGEAIRRELSKAREERDQALAKLAEVQARLERLDSEVALIKDHSMAEAESERERITNETELEIQKLREQAQREIIGAGKVAMHDLKRFAAQQSVRLAEQIIRRDLKPEDDERLINLNVEQLGRG
jgi:F-type H+-transporting ATPase subunit b